MLTKKQFKVIISILFLSYCVIFAARTIYDLTTWEDTNITTDFYFAYSDEKSEAKILNVASMRKEYEGQAGGIEVLDQKYEKSASISTKTIDYDNDVNKLNKAIENAQAVVQMEKAQGLLGNRKLSRVIGVKPQYFEQCLEAVSQIGIVVSTDSQTIDKTFEYRQMVAQTEEMKKRLDNYKSLREFGGSINERISLEDKIIEVESQLLQQAVHLGEYSDDNALCTINLALFEGSPVPLLRKIWNSFLWTTGCYFSLLVGLLVLCGASVVLVKTYVFLQLTFTKKHGNE